jgi:hypothetical protein
MARGFSFAPTRETPPVPERFFLSFCEDARTAQTPSVGVYQKWNTILEHDIYVGASYEKDWDANLGFCLEQGRRIIRRQDAPRMGTCSYCTCAAVTAKATLRAKSAQQ